MVDWVPLGLAAERLDREVVYPDQADSLLDTPVRRRRIQRDEALPELMVPRPSRVARPDQESLRLRRYPSKFEVGRAHAVRKDRQVDDVGRPHEHIDEQRLDRATTGDEVGRRIDMSPGVRAQTEVRNRCWISTGEIQDESPPEPLLSRPGGQTRPQGGADVVDSLQDDSSASLSRKSVVAIRPFRG